jgi:4-amino-4-deoxy-L-arabinose transferase-like glycosyltransferase
MPDNFALCCSVWGLALFFLWIRNNKIHTLILSGFLLSLGALSKLPFILYFSVPVTYFISTSLRKGSQKIGPVQILAAFSPILLPFAWYASVIPQWTITPTVKGILESHSSLVTILDYLQHNLVSTLPEILLGYGSFLFFIAGFYFLFRHRAYHHKMFPVFFVWGITILAYFLFEIDVIGKIHDYYLFPFFPLLFILVGNGADKLFAANRVFLKYLVIILILAAPFMCYARMQGRWDTGSPGFNFNLLAYKQELRDAVPHDALCIAGNDEYD